MPAYKRKLSRSAATAGSYKKRRLSVAQKANAALSAVRTLKRQVETKAIGFSFNSTISTTPSVTHLTAIAQGDGNNNRDGDHLNVKSIKLRGVLRSNGAQPNQSLVRVLIVQNMRQQPDTDASMASQFSSASIYAFNLAGVGFKNLYVHYDKVHAVPNGQEIAAGTFALGRKFIDVEIRPKYPVKVSYNDTATTDIDRNGFYLIAVTDVATNNPTFTWEEFTEFTDL